jgi:hypothetical protein
MIFSNARCVSTIAFTDFSCSVVNWALHEAIEELTQLKERHAMNNQQLQTMFLDSSVCELFEHESGLFISH